MRLAGHRALVTGGSTGIGLALATLSRQAGCEVLVCGRDPDKEVLVCGRDPDKLNRAAGLVPDLRTVAGDLSRPEDVRRIASAAMDLPGGLSILVNNAAVQHERSLFAEATDEALAASAFEVGTNLTGLIQLTSLCLPALAAVPASAVVNHNRSPQPSSRDSNATAPRSRSARSGCCGPSTVSRLRSPAAPCVTHNPVFNEVFSTTNGSLNGATRT
ncbi:short subunit dehydrogenase [Micromonospora sp. Llam0]|uniref:SDR family NAD(P)-dependent oxidoreductase n=1 Tax=Micromonospora sp. Llam0 TaxID=2485143 RepID=UPI000F4633AD|nr:SDR family NAD(P)-dependent oxidoreductase [Micromonospora sp. Llam0]ROO63157.1 short subunit dehydrogenase [Micromonospora sp. Llam0]